MNKDFEMITKKWEEKTVAEQIESLRYEVQQMDYVVRRVAQLEEEIRTLKNHQHSESGQVLVPVNSVNQGLSGATGLAMRNSRIS